MRFKRENWQPTIGDKFILVVTDEKAFALDKSDAKRLDKSLEDNGLHVPVEARKSLLSGSSTFYTEGIQSSSKHMVEQYRKYRNKPVIGEVPTELLIGKQFTYRYGDK